MASVRLFGQLAGRDVHAITLGSNGLRVEVLTYGAILRSLSIPVGGSRRELVLGLEDLSQYVSDAAFFGPVVGRFANRIANGRLLIDDKPCQLTQNENGNHLHGGARGLGRQLWTLRGDPTDSRLALCLRSPAGDEGYPGNLDLEMQVSLVANVLRVDFAARTDAATPLNLTWHPYFNLGGQTGRHWLRIPASRFLPVGPGLIPTGEIAAVEGTPFDFRAGRILKSPAGASHPQLAIAGGFDHCWILDSDADCRCELRAPAGDVSLKVLGSGPGLQFYGGQHLALSHPEFRDAGIALEPQGFPDAPNHRGFPDAILRPGATYHAFLEYQIGVA